jgi:hypothetical protein
MASYPNSIKFFETFADFFDVNYAAHMNEIRAEVASIEATLGTNPYQSLSSTYTSLNAALTDLYNNKAPVNHTHVHSTEADLTLDGDHEQYVAIDGTTGFNQPVNVPNATTSSQLVPLSQLQVQGYATTSAATTAVNNALSRYVTAQFQLPSTWLFGGPPGGTYNCKMGGGYNEGLTNSSGQISALFGTAFSSGLATVVATKAPIGLGILPTSIPPDYIDGVWQAGPYNYQTTECTLTSWSLSSFTLTFTNKADNSPVNHLHVGFSWFAVGV